MGKLESRSAVIAAGAFLVMAPQMAWASDNDQAVAAFYKGKTIDFLVGLSAGGGYDIFARITSRFFGKHMPGNPNIVVRNLTGGGGRIVTMNVFSVAQKNGLTLATTDRSLVLQQAIGDSTINFDMRKLTWIGNGSADNGTFTIWHTSSIKSIEDAKKSEVSIGATGWNATSQPALALNAIAGTKFKVIIGYPGGKDINLAMSRGEVAGRASIPYSLWEATQPDWLRDGKLRFIAQIGLTRSPKMPDVPLLTELASTEQDRAAMRLLSAPLAIGLPVFSTPDVPKERARALRSAFDATMKDPGFLAAAEKANLKIDPMPADQVITLVNEILDTPRSVVDRLNTIVSPPK